MKRIIVLVLILMLTGCSLPKGTPEIQAKATEIIPTAYEAEKNISVYFCPRDGCGKHLGELILSAKSYVHCGFFELNNADVLHALESQAEKD